ncbi:IDEAL domain-containing protein [Thalassobacillus hwangdonensis]|uniref:IDEAL domain-containing protein n=1 Tax=Thalassobacillus hwangdonensis TaxID=546108 RepID=A0ABW3KV32_9BACI
MKKQKINYRLRRSPVFRKREIVAKRELSFGIKLASRLFLDEMCYEFNKKKYDELVNKAIESNDRERFNELSETYRSFNR